LEGGSLAQVLSRSFPFFQSCWKVAWALANARMAGRTATDFIVYILMRVVMFGMSDESKVDKRVTEKAKERMNDEVL